VTALLAAERVSVAYGPEPALADVSFALEPGDFVGVVGPSGSGKTTLLRVLLGTQRPQVGTVLRRRGVAIGYVPQVEVIDWSFPVTVFECAVMAAPARRLRPWASRGERARVTETLERLGLGGLGSRHIRELSGGQQQRLFIARALLRDADALLLDEPTSGVDVRTRHEILHLLDDLHRDGLAVLLTTHDLNGIAAHLPELVCLNQSIVARGAPADVLTASVLERTYGAPMDVLDHAGLRIVVDRPTSRGAAASNVVRIPRTRSSA
jgi:ABC-type Mn2+/Zn2+ transport system ATPase subunit